MHSCVRVGSVGTFLPRYGRGRLPKRACTSRDATTSGSTEWSFSRWRLQIAQANRGILVGTGNKVENFGVGFYTKYGDGGVDISPIADCKKTDVWNIGKSLGVIDEIIEAAPTDGLWDDSRNDESQLGLSYEEIEDAMENSNSKHIKKYQQIREPNLHKMKPIPVCILPKD